ncbi:hypothetical protein N7512_004036 [Penicillium capsulatum]|nr:hypothetical protein N7512_004036 [Penicillium capsulatum]
MDIPSRRQDHSCDQCRKGKRRCDAPLPILSIGPDWKSEKKLRDVRPVSCSTCAKHQKDCTFEWLASREEHRKRRQKRQAAMKSQAPERLMTSKRDTGYPDEAMDINVPSPQGFLTDTNHEATSSGNPATEQPNRHLNADGWPFFREQNILDAQPAQFTSNSDRSDQLFDAWSGLRNPDRYSGKCARLSHVTRTSNVPPPHSHFFCALSSRTAGEYARSTMTQNMVRIYHDSMENALSCWLSERTCPYSKPANTLMSDGARNEWGPTWSNRICARVCRLDQASVSIRGRALSAVEDHTAARALHLSIMAFASQWAQSFPNDRDRSELASLVEEERSLRESVWSQARHALETSTGIPSFRLIFANILFSLAQRPLRGDSDTDLNELMEKDRGQVFLETAVRQMFNYRYKFMQVHQTRQISKNVAECSESQYRYQEPAMSEIEQERLNTPFRSSSTTMNNQDHDTFNLLFWLGIMFDTQTAAMYQRPPVVSDEDSQILFSTSALPHQAESQELDSFDLNGLNFSRKEGSGGKPNLWGDMLLHRSAAYQRPNITMPCSYEQAAEILSDAAPIKILLWRRVTQLQTLVYREAEAERLEKGIQRALAVYQHWNGTYNKFILDCVAKHSMLSPRIQSWYVVLAAHWHLGALLLADAIENIDRACLSSNTHRDSRMAIDFVHTLRKDNALAIAMLAHCSLHDQEAQRTEQFHDCLNGAAFITEPFTMLLINSFAKSATFFLENLDFSRTVVCCGLNGQSDLFRDNLECCIHALECLGRKADMASIVARGFSNRLKLKLASQWPIHVGLEPSLESWSTSCTPDLPIDLPYGMDSEAWVSHLIGPSPCDGIQE